MQTKSSCEKEPNTRVQSAYEGHQNNKTERHSSSKNVKFLLNHCLPTLRSQVLALKTNCSQSETAAFLSFSFYNSIPLPPCYSAILTIHHHCNHNSHPSLAQTAHPNNPSPKIPNPLGLRQTHPLPYPLRHTNARTPSANTSYRTSC